MKRIAALALSILIVGLGTTWAQFTGPTTVAKQSFLNQTEAVPPTVLFTPESNNLYRVSLYICTGSQPPPVWDVFALIRYTDDFDSVFFPARVDIISNPGVPVILRDSRTILIEAKAGTPITIETGVYGSFPPYNLYVTVEEI